MSITGCFYKLNKLLFYSDFLSYKKYGKGISGLQCQAISYGS
ncbi:type II toxin-antitoxin system antitoxin SocA domain-containing protein [Bacteroides luhongzhouii]